MRSTAELSQIFELNIAQNQPELIIYSDFSSERLKYTCQFIFHHVLGINFRITSDQNELNGNKHFVINYSDKSVKGLLNIRPNGILGESGIKETKPEGITRNNALYFYHNQAAEDTLHFDIFSSVFYFISRYEEWQSFMADKHQRFEKESSLLYRQGCHLKPMVDHWIMEFKQELIKLYPGLRFPQKNFKIISTLDVDNLFAYKHKGILRSLGATAKDVLKLDFKNIAQRFLVLFNLKPDPFDVYEEISKFCLENNVPSFWFFLFRNGTTFDRTIDPKSPAYQKVFNYLKSNKAQIGLHPSYNTSVNADLLNEEVKNLTDKSGESVLYSRQHFLRFNIKTTPQALIKNGIVADFTMGYASVPGFRAGTSFPFYYYDFDLEKEQNLLMLPFCVMDGAFTVYQDTSPDKALETMLDLAKEVKKVNGFFISVFHERTFSNHLYKGFVTLYKNLHLKLKQL